MRTGKDYLVVSALLLLGAAVKVHAAALPWTIDESVYSGAYPVFAANQIVFDYDSTITTTPGTFNEIGDFRITQYVAGFVPGVEVGTSVGPDMAANAYILWGSWEIAGSISGTEVTISQGNIRFFVDLSPANGARDADILVGTASHLAAGSGTLVPLAFDGIYDDFTLAAAGVQYWVDPAPFHSTIRFIGTTTYTEETGPGVYYTMGNGIGYFVVPEPSTLLMLAASLLGMARCRRALGRGQDDGALRRGTKVAMAIRGRPSFRPAKLCTICGSGN